MKNCVKLVLSKDLRTSKSVVNVFLECGIFRIPLSLKVWMDVGCRVTDYICPLFAQQQFVVYCHTQDLKYTVAWGDLITRNGDQTFPTVIYINCVCLYNDVNAVNIFFIKERNEIYK